MAPCHACAIDRLALPQRHEPSCSKALCLDLLHLILGCFGSVSGTCILQNCGVVCRIMVLQQAG